MLNSPHNEKVKYNCIPAQRNREHERSSLANNNRFMSTKARRFATTKYDVFLGRRGRSGDRRPIYTCGIGRLSTGAAAPVSPVGPVESAVDWRFPVPARRRRSSERSVNPPTGQMSTGGRVGAPSAAVGSQKRCRRPVPTACLTPAGPTELETGVARITRPDSRRVAELPSRWVTESRGAWKWARRRQKCADRRPGSAAGSGRSRTDDTADLACHGKADAASPTRVECCLL